MPDSTSRTPSVLAALSVVCFALAPAVARMVPESDSWYVSGMLTGLGIGLVVVALRHYLKARRKR